MKQTEMVMNDIADVLKDVFPGKGFMFMVFEFNKPSECNYISNAKRIDMIKTLRECADRLQNNSIVQPGQNN